ncbi:hypothetical protein K3495_g8076 [Podosphaera aphanis]|nr:hypothetical protein K3495_g8076 [Podosphaera aphanis]
MATSTDGLYACSACWEAIPRQRARISCQQCADCNLCSNCYVIDYFFPPHAKSHSITVVKESGILDTSNFSLAPPNRCLDESLRRASEIPTANWGALWDVMKAPLVKLERRSSKPVTRIQTPVEQDPHSGTCFPFSQIPSAPLSPPLSDHKERGSIEFPVPKDPRPDKWEPFFGDDSAPTSTFISLMVSIFSCLDDKQTGYLTPEIYANFLEMQGYPLPANIWKMAWKKAAGACSKDVADLELGLYFSQRDISHTLIARPTEDNANKAILFNKPVNSDLVKGDPIKVDHNMPLLSRQGFIDICTFEYLKDPAIAHQYLMNALQELGVWKELGDLPRSVLPSSPRIPSFQSSRETDTENNNLTDEFEEGLKSARSDRTRFESCDSNMSCLGDMNNSTFCIPEEITFNELPEPSPESLEKNTYHEIQINDPGSFVTLRPQSRIQARKGLVLRTNDIQRDSPSLTSPISTTRTPQRKKVETLIETYERAKSNIPLAEDRPSYRETLLSPKQIPKPMASPTSFTFPKEFHPLQMRPSSMVV